MAFPFIIFDCVFHQHMATDYQYDPGFNKIAITRLSNRTHLIESSYRHRARDCVVKDARSGDGIICIKWSFRNLLLMR